MGVLDSLLSSDEETPQDYPRAEFKDKEQTAEDAEYVIQTVEVKGTKDILTVKDQLNDGNIVFMEVPQTAQLSPEHIQNEIKQTVERLGGDIVARSDSELIVAPNGFYISRERL